MSLWGSVKEFFLGSEDLKTREIRELFPTPPGFLEHKDHMEVCPECKRHYLCREIVCRIVCARCWPTKERT